jgi:purine-cytosine permease-like protein
MVTLLLWAVGLVLGGVVGLAFGAIQNAAARKYKERQRIGALGSGWTIMPGSMTRVAFLLIVLALIQFCCPLLFKNDIQWLVSAGVILGYGWTLFSQFRHKAAKDVIQ